MDKKDTVFISYTHKDRGKVLLLASYLSRLGLKIWMDTKELVGGQVIVHEISKAISESDFYIVCLSKNAVQSQWVLNELNTALTLETTKGRPKVIPVMIERCNLPIALTGRLYVDFTGTLSEAKDKIRQSVESYLTELDIAILEEKEKIPAKRELFLSSLSLFLLDETVKYYGGAFNEFDKNEVGKEAQSLVEILRRRANGVLLYFVDVSEIDLYSPYPNFPNGDYSEKIEDVKGDLVGTVKKKVTIEVQILNPDESKVSKLISSELETLGVNKITYMFTISPPVTNLVQHVLKRLQDKYVILEWDIKQGAKIRLPDDLQLWVWGDDEQLRLSLETKYEFQFEKRAKQFSVKDFIKWLLEGL